MDTHGLLFVQWAKRCGRPLDGLRTLYSGLSSTAPSLAASSDTCVLSRSCTACARRERKRERTARQSGWELTHVRVSLRVAARCG